jgi:hypothetical protein
MSEQDRPGAVRFDLDSGEIPPVLYPAIAEPERPILLLVAADDSHDVAHAAIALAEARAGRGRPTILGDAGVVSPRLHEPLGLDNLEGLADVFLFGASLPRVVTRPEGYSFDFIPAGAYVPDPAGVLDSPRWDRIARELEERGWVLLLFVPAGTPGLGALSRRAGGALLLGAPGHLDRAASRLDPSCEVVGVVEVSRRPEPEPLTAGGVGGGVGGRGENAAGVGETVPRGDRAGERASPWRLLLLVILALVVVAGAWLFFREYMAAPAPTGAAEAEPAPAPPQARGQPVETPIPVSVAVEAHQDLTSARQRVAALRRAERDIDFFLSPVAERGVLYYRLLAGPVADQEAGAALLQRLVDAGHKTAYDSWAVRPTQFAFELGEYDTRAAASARMDALAEREIPSYIVTVRYEPGSPRYRVYAGAYESAGEAEVMRALLEEAELEIRLVPRTGEPAA